MSLARYLLRRAALAGLLIVIAASTAFFLTLAAPTDEPFAGADRESVQRRRAELGLDRPVLVQYVDWMGRVSRFDFGQSLIYMRPVADMVGERALNTVVLAASALVLATGLGIPFGIFTGRRRDGAGVSIVRALSVLFLSTPPLLASFALVLIAARTGWLPVGGMVSAASVDATWHQWILDVARHVPVPALALALPMAATLERLQSQAMSRAIDEPFVKAARARGLSLERADLVHGWRVSLASVLGLYGVMIATLFSGSFVVELVTAWPGLGRLMYDALRGRDLFLVAGCAAAGALSLAVATLISDTLMAIADPRVRASAGE
jgi:peptide/nickel transport system permease protein